MKKKMFLAGLIVFAFAIVVFAGNMKEAEKFMKAGMYPQAISLLKKEIYGDQDSATKANPTNAEAHFQLGICYVNQLNFDKANNRFKSAVQLDAQYGYQISQVYSDVGKKILNSDDIKTAHLLYEKAVEYQPNRRKIIADELFSTGQFCLQQDNLILGERNFSIASILDSNLNQQISTLYYDLGDSTEGERSFYFYDQSGLYSSLYNHKAGMRLLDIARTKAKIPGAEKETTIYRKEAIKHLGVVKVNSELPEYKVYPSGTYFFSLKAGEQTDHWITVPIGRGRYDINSEDSMFKILYDDGDVVSAWMADSLPFKKNFQFKIIAVTDQPKIEMVINWQKER
ncbi:hypothetical protein KKB18_10880 [bacterium]|nr:hypothetical protein [bacterium]